MKKLSPILILLILFVIFLSVNSSDDSKPKIITSFSVLKYIVEEIAPDHYEVISIIPEGTDPHTYEPLPSDQIKMNGSKIIFYIGLAFDDFILELSYDSIKTVDLSTSIIDLDPSDPHYWLSYTNSLNMADRIALELKNIDPALSPIIDDNLNEFKQKVNEDRIEAINKIGALVNKTIITEHDAYRYFAKDLGLIIAATIEPFSEGEITPQQLNLIIDSINQNSIRTIFKEHGSSSDLITLLENDYALQSEELDSEGILASNYLDMMKLNVNNIVKGTQ